MTEPRKGTCDPRYEADLCMAPLRKDQPYAVIDYTTGEHVSHHASRRAADKAARTINSKWHCYDCAASHDKHN